MGAALQTPQLTSSDCDTLSGHGTSKLGKGKMGKALKLGAAVARKFARAEGAKSNYLMPQDCMNAAATLQSSENLTDQIEPKS